MGQKLTTQIVEVDGQLVEVERGTGNVFKDLGLEDAPELTLKAQLANRIDDTIRARGLTQRRAAELTGLKSPDVSNIVNGRLDGISVERLFQVLNRLGYSIRVEVDERETECARTTFARRELTAV